MHIACLCCFAGCAFAAIFEKFDNKHSVINKRGSMLLLCTQYQYCSVVAKSSWLGLIVQEVMYKQTGYFAKEQSDIEITHQQQKRSYRKEKRWKV